MERTSRTPANKCKKRIINLDNPDDRCLIADMGLDTDVNFTLIRNGDIEFWEDKNVEVCAVIDKKNNEVMVFEYKSM
jgi:hypothetical protein